MSGKAHLCALSNKVRRTVWWPTPLGVFPLNNAKHILSLPSLLLSLSAETEMHKTSIFISSLDFRRLLPLLRLHSFIICKWHYPASKQGQTKVKRAGQCCDECAAAKGSCQYQGAVRYHGDMWNSTGCEFCTCSRGQVLCQRAECGRVECPQVSPKGKKCLLKLRGKAGPILKICGCKVKIPKHFLRPQLLF